MTTIDLARTILKAETAMARHLKKTYPVGTTVRFFLMFGQVNLSSGEVIAYTGGRHALLRVRLNSRARPTRDIAAFNIVK